MMCMPALSTKWPATLIPKDMNVVMQSLGNVLTCWLANIFSFLNVQHINSAVLLKFLFVIHWITDIFTIQYLKI